MDKKSICMFPLKYNIYLKLKNTLNQPNRETISLKYKSSRFSEDNFSSHNTPALIFGNIEHVTSTFW